MSSSDYVTADGKNRKVCFVTIGATAGFQSLIKAVLDIKFICALSYAGYSELRVQYGQDGGPIFNDFVEANRDVGDSTTGSLIEGVLISGFDFKLEGLAEDMRDAKGGIDDLVEGVVISHAGESLFIHSSHRSG